MPYWPRDTSTQVKSLAHKLAVATCWSGRAGPLPISHHDSLGSVSDELSFVEKAL